MVMKITTKFVDELKMVLLEKKVELIVSQDVIRWLMKKGFDKVYGARPLARCVDEHLKKALVDELLFGRLVDGGRVNVELDKEILKFHFSTTQGTGNGQKNQKQPVTT
ncbi:ATP-dependent Clp protease ATP-binding subunit ClpA [compost metagenome]